ncbi:MAG: hypothetical protein CMN74_02430 [Sphingorhabdus sp.]|nr:hypothetical protein [Sphingorhabdus sp.]
MSRLAFAYLREGGVYRDYESWENSDRLGTYVVVHASKGRQVETNVIGGKRYQGLWIWNEKDSEEGRDYGTIPLLVVDE